MLKIRSLIRRRLTLIYFVLTFVLTWSCMALAVYPGGFPITEAQYETAGALVYVAMLVGPAGAAILLTGISNGKTGLRELFSRLFRWRVNARWYAVALLTAPVMITTVLLGLALVSSELQPALFTASAKPTVVLPAIAAGLVVGLFEELGWTGLAVPGLKGRYGVMKTGLIVGVVWGAWHFLPFWERDSFSAALPLALLLGQLFSWLPPYRILMVWVYDRTGSLLLAVLMHASLMASLSILVPGQLSTPALLTWILSWAAALWIIVAGVVVVKGGRIRSQSAQKQVA